MQRTIWRLLGGAIAPLFVIGCGGSAGVKTYPVKGVVTFQGQPLADGIVSFYPESGRPASGVTNAQGEFFLSTFQPQDGAAAGAYKVALAEPTVQSAEGDYSVPEEKPPRFPVKYTDPSRSGLTAAVKPAADNTFTFDLKE